MGWGGKKGGKSGHGTDDVMLAMEMLSAMGGMDNMAAMMGGMGGMDNMAAMMGMMGGMGGMGGMGMMGGKGGKGVGKGQVKGGNKKQAKGPAQNVKQTKPVSADLPWKSRLQQAYTTEHKINPTKDSIVYTAVLTEGSGFTCTLSCDKFSTEYETEEVHDCKKVAEEAVALAALKGEFPKIYNAVPGAMKKKGATGGAGAAAASRKAAEKNGTLVAPVKRKDPSTEHSDAKSRLSIGLQVLAARSLTKADIEYKVEEVNGSSVATVTLNCVEDGATTFKGKPSPGSSKESKKQAEQNAAVAALKTYQHQIDERMPEHVARKEQKKAEFIAKGLNSAGLA